MKATKNDGFENAKNKCLRVILDSAKKRLNGLINDWITLYGFDRMWVLERQLEATHEHFFNEVITENSQIMDKMKNMNKELLEKKQDGERKLNEGIKNLPNENLSLYDFHKKLKIIVDENEMKIKVRQEEFERILKEESLVCDELDISTTLKQFAEELPSESQLKGHKEYITTLEDMKYNHLELVCEYQQNIDDLILKLGLDAEAYLKFLKNDIKPSEKNINSLKSINFGLEQKYSTMTSKCKTLKKKLREIWRYLEISDSPHEKLFHIPVDFCVLSRLEVELDRCEKVKHRKLSSEIEKTREKLVKYMKLCRKSEKFCHNSVMFDVLIYDNDVLQRHQNEFLHLEKFYDTNKNIFMLVDEREQLKMNLQHLTIKKNDSRARLKNRGGQLLKEEQERKTLERKIYKTEIALIKEVDNYKALNNESFTVNGEEIQVDRNITTRLEMKKQMSCPNLRLKKPFADRTNI